MRFPTINILDDVAAQHRLVTEEFGIRRVALVTGYSMGAQQTSTGAGGSPVRRVVRDGRPVNNKAVYEKHKL